MSTGRLSVGTVAVVAGFAGLAFVAEKIRVTKPVILMSLFLAWSGIGYLFTNYPLVVSERLVEFLKLVLIVFLAVNSIRTRRQALFYLMAIQIFYLAYPVRAALTNYFIHDYTAFGRAVGSGIYINSNDLAALTLLQLSVALSMFVGLKNKIPRVFFLGAAGLMLLVILLTQSRGVYLGTGVFFAIVIWQSRRKVRAILGLSIFAAMLVAVAPSSTFERFQRLGETVFSDRETIVSADEEGSAAGRRDIYRLALQISGEHPLVGIGLGAYPLANEEYARYRDDIVGWSSGRVDAHSTYLSAMAETGVPGLLLLLALFVTVLHSIRRVRVDIIDSMPSSGAQLAILMAGYVGFLVAAVVGTYKNLAMTYVHLAAIWILAESFRNSNVPDVRESESGASSAVQSGT
jgi:O-antigen ligase